MLITFERFDTGVIGEGTSIEEAIRKTCEGMPPAWYRTSWVDSEYDGTVFEQATVFYSRTIEKEPVAFGVLTKFNT